MSPPWESPYAGLPGRQAHMIAVLSALLDDDAEGVAVVLANLNAVETLFLVQNLATRLLRELLAACGGSKDQAREVLVYLGQLYADEPE